MTQNLSEQGTKNLTSFVLPETIWYTERRLLHSGLSGLSNSKLSEVQEEKHQKH
uniref:tRNA synthetase class 1 family protein n=1 Tax=Rhizophora mucronata TaxID=61149 RepID=A0A2P2LNS5_RHIMU